MEYRKEYALNLLLSVVSVVVFFTVSELIVSLFWYSEMHGDTCMEDHAEIGYVHRNNCVSLVKQPEGELIEYKYNACGFRNDDFDCWPEKGKHVVLSIGDSFSEGAMVSEDDMYTHVAERIIKADGKDVVFINAGVSGYDIVQYYQRINELVDEYQPEIVLIGLLPNDLFSEVGLSVIEERKDIYSKLSRQESYKEINMKSHGGLFSNIKREIMRFSLTQWLSHHLLGVDSIYYASYVARSGDDSFLDNEYSPLWENKIISAGDILNEINKRVKAIDGKLIVVAIPQRIQALFASRKFEVEGKDPHALVNKLRKTVSGSGIKITNFLEDMEGVDDAEDYYYVLDGHLTAEGHSLLGKHVAANIKPMLGGI